MGAIRLAPEVLRKTPLESIRRELHFTDGLAEDETIIDVVSFGVTPSGGSHVAFIDSPVARNGLIQVFLSGGVSRTRYEVRVMALTSTGQQLEGVGRLVVDDAS